MDKQATQKDFAEIIGVSAAAVSDMASRGVIVHGLPVGEWIRSYCSHIREQAAGRATAGDLNLAAERAALAKAQRARIEMQNAVTRGELAPVILIEQVLTKVAGKVAGIFDAIPGMVRRRVPHLTSDEIELIAIEIAKARNTVSGMSLAAVDDALDEHPEVQDSATIIDTE